MDWSSPQRQRLHSLFGLFFSHEITASILALSRPALRLAGVPAAADDAGAVQAAAGRSARAVAVRPERPRRDTAVAAVVPLTATRLGGTPMLPADEAWPRWDARPLDFLALLDFAELAAVCELPGLPVSGTASIFAAGRPPLPWGGEPGHTGGRRVFSGMMTPAEAPEGVRRAPARPLSTAPFLSLPGPGEPELVRLASAYTGILEVYRQLYEAWLEHVWGDGPLHQIGGWPVPVREPLHPGDGAVLLLQLDSDDGLGWQWGDAGRAYFTVVAGDPVEHARLSLQAP